MDAARFPAMSESLRAALTAVLEEKLDYEAIQGANRLLAGANLASNAAAAITTFADYLSRFCYGRIDGRYAMMAGDVRMLMGAGTYAHAGATYRANEDSTNALDRLMEKTGGVRVSAHVPVVAGNKQNAVVRLGMRRAMVQPVWNNVRIITDDVTRSGSGEIEVTAIMGMDTKILRADDGSKQETKHA